MRFYSQAFAARLALLSLHPLQARSHPYTLMQNLRITPRDWRLTSHACDHHKKYQIPKCNSSFNPHFLCLGVHRTTSKTSSLENGQESRWSDAVPLCVIYVHIHMKVVVLSLSQKRSGSRCGSKWTVMLGSHSNLERTQPSRQKGPNSLALWSRSPTPIHCYSSVD